jgi:hypothetical protein
MQPDFIGPIYEGMGPVEVPKNAFNVIAFKTEFKVLSLRETKYASLIVSVNCFQQNGNRITKTLQNRWGLQIQFFRNY